MTTAEILARVRRIEIKTKGLSNHIFAGEYHTAFKGRGMSFSEVREYAVGDDVRNIDWNVTARSNTPHVKVFEEERELTVMLLVDISRSSLFGTSSRSKRDTITEIGAVLSFSASTNNDKVGAIFFSDKMEHFIPPKKGRSHILRIIRQLIALEPDLPQRNPVDEFSGSTRLALALEYLNNVLKKRSITFILSDLVSAPYEQALVLAARRHDVVGIQVYDQADRELPKLGLVQVADAETGERRWIDTSDKHLRVEYRRAFEGMREYGVQAFRKAGASLLSLRSDDDYVKTLDTFFRAR
ncbi:MAG: DUF58 domain-containing protein [Bacteroidetes bacterium]|nr:DUF58 domain-containing protein [Bacteroidota bacterium]MBS1630846.1 DUF58 domain-containing protein [Bacteroidota bacterium]